MKLAMKHLLVAGCGVLMTAGVLNAQTGGAGRAAGSKQTGGAAQQGANQTGGQGSTQNTGGSQNGNDATGAVPGNAANANVRSFWGPSQTPWFGRPEVRQGLNMTDAQYRQLSQNYNKAWTDYNKGVSGMGRSLTDQQAWQRQQELYGTFNNSFSRGLDTSFTDPATRRRYDQLYRQYQGYGAFSDPAVRKELSLTDDQISQFDKYNREWN